MIASTRLQMQHLITVIYCILRVHLISLTILDVVQAYKGIQKEKEALEASLSILTTSTPSSSATTSDNQENDEINNESASSMVGTSASVPSPGPGGDLINKQNQSVSICTSRF